MHRVPINPETRIRRLTGNQATLRLAFALMSLCCVLVLAGCSPSTNSSSMQELAAEPTRTVTSIDESDIASASAVVRAHVDALARGDAAAYEATLGAYQRGDTVNGSFDRKSRAWRGVVIESLRTPGRYIPDSPPSSYLSNYGKPPYKMVVLNVRFVLPEDASDMVPEEWDYIVVQEAPEGDWLIHDWGR